MRRRFVQHGAMRVKTLTATRSVSLGGEVEIELTLEPSVPVKLAAYRAKARIVSREVFVDDENGRSADISELHLPLEMPADFRAPFQTSWKVRLPDDTPPSFNPSSGRYLIQTFAEVDLAWDSFGALRLQAPIIVLPEYAS